MTMPRKVVNLTPSHRAQAASPGEAEVPESAADDALSDFEYAHIILMFGFSRWVENCMEAAQVRGLNALDILVLHAVNHRARGRRLVDVAMVLNVGETHLIAYALKKLVAAGLVAVRRIGRERQYEATPMGDAACLAYREVRSRHLVESLAWMADAPGELSRCTGLLRAMTALYDQAGRFATAEAQSYPRPPPVRTKR